MKRIILSITILTFLTVGAFAQTKRDGTPDMRYKANRQSSSYPSYTPPKQQRNYNNGGQYRVQKGYSRSNGSYIAPHYKTTPDNKTWNNRRPSN